MNSVTIRKEIKIAASATQLWPYIGTAAGLRRWWGVEVTLEEKLGGYCAETGLQHGQPYQLVGEVTAYEPPHRLSLTLQRQGDHDDYPLRTELEITLAEEAAHTTVAIVHRAYGAIAAIGATSAVDGALHGPLMGLSGYQGQTRPVPCAPSVPVTTWQQQQAVQWQRRCVALRTLGISMLQQEVVFA
jgi:uncharacterized protein YndB with AHSA1/START domain